MKLSLIGIPNKEIMDRVDIIKAILMESIKNYFIIFSYKKWIRSINFISQKVFNIPDITSRKLTESAVEISRISTVFMKNIGFTDLESYEFSVIIKYVVGFDLAYRLRIQDVLIELNKDSFLKNPRLELKRLWKIYESRESIIGSYMLPKARNIFDLLLLALYIPKFKRALKNTIIELDKQKINFTDEDIEWIKVRKDYEFKSNI